MPTTPTKGLTPDMFKTLPRGVEVITKDKEKQVRREFEDSTVYVWKTTSPIVNRMNQKFKVSIRELYASSVGQIFSETPFYRGKLFTNGVTRHEFLHWGIYPIDIVGSVKDLFEARDLLFFELGISKNDKNWGKKFPYELGELQLYQNMIGDYLIHVHMAKLNSEEWRVLWQFLMVGGHKQKRDSTFKIYIAVYPRILPSQSTPMPLGDPKSEKDADLIADLIQKCYKGDVGKPYAIKEIAKILHKYYEEDKKHPEEEGEDGDGDPNCPKCGANDWEVEGVIEQDANGNPTKIKVRCKKCGHTMEVKVNPYGSGALKPNKQAHGIKVKWSKEDADKIMEASKGADRNDLGEIGIDLSKEDYVEALQRAKIRRFIKEHVVISKDKFMKEGEQFRVSTDVWQMGDSLLDINIPSSEIASLGIDDLRMIPTVTLKKNVYVTTKGTDYEKLKGVKYFGFLDVSGSMSGFPERKALAMLKEVWECSKKLDFDFHLCLFSTRAKRVAQADLKRFFEDASFRQSCGNLGGGTCLSEGFKQFDDVEYKDANIVVISDCDIGDVAETKEEMLKIAQHTNSFKIIIIRESERINDEEIKRLQDEWFPNREVKVLGVSTNAEDFSYER